MPRRASSSSSSPAGRGGAFVGARGLKARLPVKPCASCGRPMAWRRAWARTWDEVRWCSEACRRTKARDA